MPILGSAIKWYLSGGVGNSDPNASLGGIRSNTEISATALHNIFDKVLGTESDVGDTEYRCIYVRNEDGSARTLELAKIFLTNTVDPANVISIALAGEGKNGTAETIADESTAPIGETFSQPTDYATGLALGDLAVNDFYAIWIRRVISASQAAKDSVTFTPEVQGDSPE